MHSNPLPPVPDARVPLQGESISVVITYFNEERYLADALRSVQKQILSAHEIIVVDDGSDRLPDAIVAAFPGVRLLRQDNGGLSSARNAGLHAATGTYICYLDADDRLLPNALSSALECFRRQPDAAMVYGGHRRIHPDGSIAGIDSFWPANGDMYCDLLEGNCIGMHAAVVFRRDVLVESGGYDEQLRRCEDYDLYLRIAGERVVASHPDIVAEYRWHGENMSRDRQTMLDSALKVHARHRPKKRGVRLEAWKKGERGWKDWYNSRQEAEWDKYLPSTGGERVERPRMSVTASLRMKAHRFVNVYLPGFVRGRWPPPFGTVNLGSFASTKPVSRDFGWDRGTPVDRYYIANFLAANAGDIKGRVLEIGDDAYSVRFGGGEITRQDVLHVDLHHPKATLTGDLTNPQTLPDGAFDCIVLTQTLHVIFNMNEAAERLIAALKPGGVLLLTVPGISPVDRLEWKESWFWSLTEYSLRRLFEAHLDSAALTIATFGNVFAAVTFLTGMALEEVDTKKLDVSDPAFPVVITLRARKPL